MSLSSNEVLSAVQECVPGKGGAFLLDCIVQLPRVGELCSSSHPCRIWLDNGASATLIRRDMWNNRESCFIEGPKKRVLGAFGYGMFSDFTTIEFTINGIPSNLSVNAYLVDPIVLKGRDILLGSDVLGKILGLLVNDSDKFFIWPLGCKSKLTPVVSAEKDYHAIEQTENPLTRIKLPFQVQFTQFKVKTVEAMLGDIFALKSKSGHKESRARLDFNTTSTSSTLLDLNSENLGNQVNDLLFKDHANLEVELEADLNTTLPNSNDVMMSGNNHGIPNGPELIIQDGEGTGPTLCSKAGVHPTKEKQDHLESTQKESVADSSSSPTNRQTRRLLARLRKELKPSEVIKSNITLREKLDPQVTKPTSAPKKKALQKKKSRLEHTTKREKLKEKQVALAHVLREARRYEEEVKVTPTSSDSTSSTNSCMNSIDLLNKKKNFVKDFLTTETNFSDSDITEIVSQVTITAVQDPSKVTEEIVFEGPPDKKRDTFVFWSLNKEESDLIAKFTNKFSDVILQKDSKFTCGQAPFEFDIEFYEGGEEKLSKIKKKVYPLKGPQKDLLKETIPEMEKMGLGTSKPLPGDVLYTNPVFYTKKARTDKLRLCVDTTDLNKYTKDIEYPIPIIDEIIVALKGKKYFSIIDLKQGFNQFPLSMRARKYLNMATQCGIFQFHTLPFGPKNGPKFFQHCMCQIFKEVLGEFVHVYIDDIIVFSDTFEEHMSHLEKVFDILRQNKLVAQIDKCFFCLKQLKYLGKVVSGDGVQTDPDTVSYMVNYPIPKNVKDVRSFIGLCSHYRNFVTGFALIAEPLIKLTRSNEEWHWGQDQQKAFEKLKERMVQSPVLAHPDWSKDFYLQTDASKLGAGAILAQKDNNGKFHPIAYSSWLFNPAQRNYTTTERELLAIVLATRKWRSYLYGSSFKVETDHKPLTGKWDWTDPYGKVTRWASELRQFDMSITYVKGKDNEHTDALSRIFCEEVLAGISWEIVDQHIDGFDFEVVFNMTTEEVEQENHFKPATIIAKEPVSDCYETIMSLSFDPIPDDKSWAEAQKSDDWYKHMIRWIETGDLPIDNVKAKWVLVNSPHFSIDPITGILLRNSLNNSSTQLRRCVPKQWRKLITSICHDSKWVGAHMGRDKTIQRVSERFYFPNLSEYIEAYIAICPSCQCSKHSKLKPKVPMGTIESDCVWDLVCIDLWKAGITSKVGNKYVLTVVDAYSKYAFAIPISGKKAKFVASALVSQVIADKGPMRRLHSDQGREFCNSIISEMCDLFGIEKTRTTAYHPMGNAFAERIHQFYRSAITSFVNESGDRWDEFLPPLRLAYNTAMHSALAVSPYFMMYGRESNLPGLILDPPVPLDPSMTYAQRLKYALYKTQELMIEKRYLSAAKKRLANLDLVIPKYSPGDRVKMEIPKVKPGASRKLKFIWSGPWEISRQGRNPKVYYLKDEYGVELTSPISVARLLPWNSPEDFPILEDEFIKQPLVIVNSTGDLVDYGSSNSEDETDTYVDNILEDENFQPDELKGVPPVGSNPAIKYKEDRPLEDPKKVKPGVLSKISLPDTLANRLLLGHGAKRDQSTGIIYLEQRLVPQGEKRRRKQVTKMNL